MPASTTVRERDYDDTRSVRSHQSHRSQPRAYTTVRRYKYPGTLPDEEQEDETMRVVIRERDRGHSDHEEDIDIKISEHERHSDRGRRETGETYRIIRRVSRSRSRSSSSSSSSEEEVEETRTVRSAQSPYTLEKYSKSTEYFNRPQPQQPIIIRERNTVRPIIMQQDAPRQIVIREAPRQQPQQTIVIRERPREPEQRKEDRSQDFDEEDYYYYRGPVGGARHRHHRGHGHEGRHRRGGEREAYSDDDAGVLIRRERSVSSSPDPTKRRRDVAGGVVAGLATAAVVRNRRKSKGEKSGSRIGQYLGYGALGGVGGEVLSRIQNRSKSRSRSRDDDREYRGRDRRRHSGSRSRSRSKSITTGQALAGVAALGGLAALAYAAGRKKAPDTQTTTIINEEPHRRSRSHRRGSSVAAYSDSELPPPSNSALNPQHRNATIAKAGVAGAALAGLNAFRTRSKSRGRSKSRVREGVPIIATGLASAAIAGLYEKQKAKKERSRSRSVVARSASVPRSRRASAARDAALVEYGDSAIEPEHHHRRRRHHRHRSSSGSRSPHRRQQSRSRSRGVAETAGVAAAAAVAANEVSKRRERRRSERERRRQDEQAAANDHRYPPSTGYSPSHDAPPGSFCPSSNAFPPPPNAEAAPPVADYNHNYGGHPPQHQYPPNPSHVDSGYDGSQPAPYNPAAWGATRGPTLPREDLYKAEGYHDQPYDAYNHHDPHGYRDPGAHGGHNNVNGLRRPSSPEEPIHSRHVSPPVQQPQPERSVKFNLDEKRYDSRSGPPGNQAKNSIPMTDRYPSSNPPHRHGSPTDLDPNDSDATIEDPELINRFDAQGRQRHPSGTFVGNVGPGRIGNIFGGFRGF